MPNKQGDFVWYELLSPDVEASAGFYSGLLGWKVGDNPEYREITASEGMIGGMLPLTPEMTSGGARPAWLGYIAVDDADAALQRVEAAGGASQAFAAERPMEGHCAWNELSSDDPPAAWRFYGDLFGWVKDGDMDMGPMGKYEFIRHGFMLGAIMPRMPQMPVSAWTFYFRVADIDAAHEYARANGATVLMEPMEIPGGEYSLNILDPQGAAVGLVGPRK